MRDDELLHRFLLGELAEDEAESLERRLLQEEEPQEDELQEKGLFELGEAIEGDLLAASARGELTPAENRRLLARVTASPGGRARLATARSLVRLAQEVPAEPIPAPLPFRPAAAPPPRRAVRWMALAATLLFFAVGGSWLVNEMQERMHLNTSVRNTMRNGPVREDSAKVPPEVAQRQPEPEKRPAERPAPPEPEPSVAPEPAPSLKTAVFQLALASRRSVEPAEELPRFKVPSGAGEIEIQLDLGGEEQSFSTFNALVRSYGLGEVWSGQGLAPQTLDWGTVLILEIPAKKLPDGRYEMEVQGVSAEGQAERIGVQEFEIVAE